MTNRPIVAMMYDFDRTLCTKDMQEYGFIPAIKMTAQEFWNEVNEMTDREKMDNILAYMVQNGREGERTTGSNYFGNLSSVGQTGGVF